MKLNVGFKVSKHLTLGPHKDYYPDSKDLPNLYFAGGYYQCESCRAVTGWRLFQDGITVAVCSTECIAEVVKRMSEVAQNDIATPIGG